MGNMSVHEIQAAAAGVQLAEDTVELKGRRFRMAASVGLMPLMRFAMTAKKGVESDDLEGLAAMYTLIRDCVDQTKPQKPILDEDGQPVIGDDGQPVTEDDGPSEWDRFEQHAIDSKAEAEDLMKVVTDVIQRLSARPTRRPGDSSPGPQTTSASSMGISSTPQDPPPPPPAAAPARRTPAGVEDLIDIRDIVNGKTPANSTA